MGPEDQFGLRAKVVNLNGTPVSDVEFHYIFYIGYDIVTRNPSFSYDLQTADTVTLKVFDPFDQEVATLLDNQFEPAGQHVHFYDASGITNGVYEFRLTTLASTTKTKFFIRTDDISQFRNTRPFLRSDPSGNLRVSYSSLGIGDRFVLQIGDAASEIVIADSIAVLLVKQGYRDLLRAVRLDTTENTDVTFQLLYN